MFRVSLQQCQNQTYKHAYRFGTFGHTIKFSQQPEAQSLNHAELFLFSNHAARADALRDTTCSKGLSYFWCPLDTFFPLPKTQAVLTEAFSETHRLQQLPSDMTTTALSKLGQNDWLAARLLCRRDRGGMRKTKQNRVARNRHCEGKSKKKDAVRMVYSVSSK